MLRSNSTSHAGDREVVAFCPTADAERLLLESLKLEAHLKVFREWSAVETAAVRADCVVAFVPWLDDPVAGRHLRSVERRAPETPVVVVTSTDIENSRLAVRLHVDEVVWRSDIKRTLSAAVLVAMEQSFLHLVAANVLHAVALPPAVQNAIAGACLSRLPVSSVGELVDLSGAGRSKLARAWKKVAPPGLTEKRFLNWLLLLRAAARRAPDVSWASVVTELGVDQDTLGSIADRLVHLHLSEITVASIGRLREEFSRVVLVPLGIRTPRAEFR